MRLYRCLDGAWLKKTEKRGYIAEFGVKLRWVKDQLAWEWIEDGQDEPNTFSSARLEFVLLTGEMP